MRMSPIELLSKELCRYGFSSLTTLQQEKLLAYLTLLEKWNQKHNLTRIKKGDQFNLHVLDAASIAPFCHGDRILDVGSGAGIPGIPLSILLPNKKFVLIDNQSKKCIFLKYVINDLALDNVECINQSVQTYQVENKFDVIVSRAFAQIAKFVQLCEHLLAPEGIFLAMKGDISAIELSGIPEHFELRQKESLEVPGAMHRYAIVIAPKPHPDL